MQSVNNLIQPEMIIDEIYEYGDLEFEMFYEDEFVAPYFNLMIDVRLEIERALGIIPSRT